MIYKDKYKKYVSLNYSKITDDAKYMVVIDYESYPEGYPWPDADQSYIGSKRALTWEEVKEYQAELWGLIYFKFMHNRDVSMSLLKDMFPMLEKMLYFEDAAWTNITMHILEATTSINGLPVFTETKDTLGYSYGELYGFSEEDIKEFRQYAKKQLRDCKDY